MVDKFFHPKVHTGWSKNESLSGRRRKVLKAHKGDILASGRAMQALANVTTDHATKVQAQADANYFYRLNKKK